jgi:hypothetical protein
VGDEEGGPTHSICGIRSLAPYLDHGGDELQFSVAVCIGGWRTISCCTMSLMKHLKFGTRFESSVGDSLSVFPLPSK